MNYRKGNKQKNDVMKYIPLFMALFVILFTICYATLSDALAVDGSKAFVRIDKNIRLTDFRVDTLSHGGLAEYTQFSYKNGMSTISLPNSNSSVTYTVSVTNYGNADMTIQSITGLPNGLKYTLVGYALEAILCDNIDSLKCNLGSVTTFQIVIEYDENGYDGITTDYNLNLVFDFQEQIYTARMDGVYYASLQNAVNAVPTNHTEKTITLLKNSSERVTVTAGKDIILDLQGLTLTNSGNLPVIEIKGTNANNNSLHGATVKISNGTIRTNGTQGAINVENEGILIMTGGTIEAIGNRQAIYVDVGGTATISGSAYLTAQAQVETDKNRGTVQTVVGGTLNILGGTIEATGTDGIAVSNAGTTTIGTEDGSVSTSSPLMKGVSYGIYIVSGTLNYYDGISKGKVLAINDEQAVNDIESGYDFFKSSETINGDIYRTIVLATGSHVTVTFNPDGGTVSEATRQVLAGSAVGALPIPERTGFAFLGWFDSNGRQISDFEVINSAIMYTAHWQDLNRIARIGADTYYPSLQAAVNAVPTDNTQTTIVLLADITTENIVVAAGQNIIFDTQNHTVSAPSGLLLDNSGTVRIQNGTWLRNGTADQNRVIVNKSSGTLNITGGTIQSDVWQAIQNFGTMNMSDGFVTIDTAIGQGVVNNESGGIMNISGGSVIGTVRQSVYNDGGTLTISGNAYFESPITGTDKVRATIQNNKGTVYIRGGTIISTSTRCPAVLNSATMTIGTDDGVVSGSSPVIQGNYYGLRLASGKKANYYDGIIRGGSTYGAVDGESLLIINNNTSINHRTETIGATVYDVVYLS